MSDKKTEQVLVRDEKLKREQVIGTDGKPVWIPIVAIGGTNRELSNRDKMKALGWTDEELERTAKFAPRAPRRIMADGTQKGAYKFSNGVSYQGFGSMYDDLEREEERARQHGKGIQTVTVTAPVTINKTAVTTMGFVPLENWEAAIAAMDLDENTKKYLTVLKSLKELKADKKIEKVFEEFANIFTKVE